MSAEQTEAQAFALLEDPRLRPIVQAFDDFASLAAQVMVIDAHRRTPDLARALVDVEIGIMTMQRAMRRAQAEGSAVVVARLRAIVSPVRASIDRLRPIVERAIGKQIADEAVRKAAAKRMSK